MRTVTTRTIKSNGTAARRKADSESERKRPAEIDAPPESGPRTKPNDAQKSPEQVAADIAATSTEELMRHAELLESAAKAHTLFTEEIRRRSNKPIGTYDGTPQPWSILRDLQSGLADAGDDLDVCWLACSADETESMYLAKPLARLGARVHELARGLDQVVPLLCNPMWTPHDLLLEISRLIGLLDQARKGPAEYIDALDKALGDAHEAIGDEPDGNGGWRVAAGGAS